MATDDERIAAVVRGFGGEVRADVARITRPGTDRLAEAVRAIDAEIVVNVQGDEPMLDPAGIDAAVRAPSRGPAAADGDPVAAPARRRGDARARRW